MDPIEDTDKRIAGTYGIHLRARRKTCKVLDRLILQKSAAPEDAWTQASSIIDNAIQQVRTMSHLLHPPLLDEVGLLSALAWYVDGLNKRSGIETSLDVQPGDFPRQFGVGLRLSNVYPGTPRRNHDSRQFGVARANGPSWMGVPETVMRYDKYLWRRPGYQKTQ
jgi:hypothetical protein